MKEKVTPDSACQLWAGTPKKQRQNENEVLFSSIFWYGYTLQRTEHTSKGPEFGLYIMLYYAKT